MNTSCETGGPFMMNLNVAVELRSPSFSHCFCVDPRMVRPGSDMAVAQEGSVRNGRSASPAPPPVHVESSSVRTKPEVRALQQVYLAERYWRSSIRKNSAPAPSLKLR